MSDTMAIVAACLLIGFGMALFVVAWADHSCKGGD